MSGNIPPKDIGAVQLAEMLVDRPHTQNNQPSIIPASMQIPSQEHLAKPSHYVTFQNTDQVQTHIVINRHKQGVALQPGEKKVIEMVVDESETFRHLARTDRGFYPDGPKKGQPFPAHPGSSTLDRHAATKRCWCRASPSGLRSKRDLRAPR